jgi:hypothetical protein
MIARSSFRRALAAAAACAAAASIAGFATAGPASAAVQSTPAGAARLILRKVPLRAGLSPALKALLARAGASPASTTWYGYELLNLEKSTINPLCLDAQSSGSLAGKDGDKVQLWTCNETNNQVWIPVNWEYNGDNWSVMVNDQYQSMCLNAVDAGGLANGRHVQLWNCDVGGFNQIWNFGAFENGNTKGLYLDNSSPFVLDAQSQHIGDGDQVQIWQPDGLLNQQWAFGSWQVSCPTC